MPPAAPRVDARLVRAISRLDDRSRPIAEINRLVGRDAEGFGLPRPSYEQVRVHVHAIRGAKALPGIGGVLLDIAFRVAPPEALLDALAGPDPRPDYD